MQQFFETQDGKYVNLREVTSIAFEEYVDRFRNKKYKIIFNMNYGVTLRSTDKIVSDYVYSIYDEPDVFRENFDYLMNLVHEYQWISCNEPRIVNPDHISFMTQDYRKNRIILNMASSVSFNSKSPNNKTSDFVYINCTENDFDDKLNEIREILDNLIL